jgi:hypothetical protein
MYSGMVSSKYSGEVRSKTRSTAMKDDLERKL